MISPYSLQWRQVCKIRRDLRDPQDFGEKNRKFKEIPRDWRQVP